MNDDNGLAVGPGEPAPDFTLPSTSGGNVSLLDHCSRDNVLLAFFPLAFTPVCTGEFCAFTDDIAEFTRGRTVVYGISVDSVPTLQAFRQTHGIVVDLLSDFKRVVSRRYGTLLEDPFFSRRAYVLVDREGIVRWTFAEADLGQRRETRELLAQLDALP